MGHEDLGGILGEVTAEIITSISGGIISRLKGTSPREEAILRAAQKAERNETMKGRRQFIKDMTKRRRKIVRECAREFIYNPHPYHLAQALIKFSEYFEQQEGEFEIDPEDREASVDYWVMQSFKLLARDRRTSRSEQKKAWELYMQYRAGEELPPPPRGGGFCRSAGTHGMGFG